MNLKQNEKKEKKPYGKPELAVIDLAAEEVLFTGCKLASSGNAPFNIPCIANSCSAAGT